VNRKEGKKGEGGFKVNKLAKSD